MPTPIVLNTGITNVSFRLNRLDNAISVELNPDGAQPAGNGRLGWSRVLEMNKAGFGGTDGSVINLSNMLAAFKSQGATSVTLCVVVSNWAGPGFLDASINWPTGSQPVAQASMAPFTSVQFAYTLVL